MTFGQFPDSHDALETVGSDDEQALQCMRNSAKAAREPLVPPATVVDMPLRYEPVWKLVASLLQQDPSQRIGTSRPTTYSWRTNLYEDLRAHQFFDGLDWDALAAKRVSPLDLCPPLCAAELNRDLTS